MITTVWTITSVRLDLLLANVKRLNVILEISEHWGKDSARTGSADLQIHISYRVKKKEEFALVAFFTTYWRQYIFIIYTTGFKQIIH
jgi:hypothetical protein